MTAGARSPLRVVSFGDLEGRVWGAAIDAGEPAIIFETPDGNGSAVGTAAVALEENPAGWSVAGDGFELHIAPAVDEPAQDPRRAGAGQLCRIEGTLTVAGTERPVQCVGARNAATGLSPERLQSVRGVCGWFASDRALNLLALRPAGANGNESDVIAATVFEPDGWIAVDEPRLSTTFRADGRPSRASLELWIADGEEQYARRAAAEASGAGGQVEGDGVRLEVTPLRCHTGGLDGAGVYVLARF